ncbi:MAG: FkbM family methyltransferase [Magnetococcales bacterium]|nr:FkbM family methyltransferase [Magnetococcales bacterium]
MKDYSHLPFGVRHLRAQWRVWRLSLKNARRAFRPGELFYQLAIGQAGAFQVAFRRGTSDEKVIAHSFDQDIFFSGTPEYRPQPHHTILDIGAHIGGFALVAARKVPAGRVYAVEACQETFDYLRVNVALNRLDNITAERLAIADQRGVVRLYHDDGNWGHSIMAPLSPVWEETPTLSLAEYLAERGVESVDFIKMNCEGAEFPILMAAPVTLLQRVGCMLVLYHADLSPRHTLDELRAHLHAAGFVTRLRHQDGDRGWLVALRENGPSDH